MDNAFNLSSGKIIRALAEAEVMSIFFPRVGKALIVDTRHDADHGPVVLMDDMVGSAEERLQSVRRLRTGIYGDRSANARALVRFDPRLRRARNLRRNRRAVPHDGLPRRSE